MPHKEFVSSKPMELEGPSFSVDGQKFRCLAKPPHGFIADLIESSRGNFYSASAMRNFIRGALISEDEPAWDQLQYAKSNGSATADVDLLSDVFAYLVEEYFQRPTQPPSGSPDGRPSTTDTSPADSPSPEPASTESTT